MFIFNIDKSWLNTEEKCQGKDNVEAWTSTPKKINFPVMLGIKSPTVPATDQSNPNSSTPPQHPDTRVGNSRVGYMW